MLETNLRIVEPGIELELVVYRAYISGPDLTADLLQRACGHLQHRYRLAAIPAAAAVPMLYASPRTDTDAAELLVLTDRPIPSCKQEGDDWEFEVKDAGLPAVRLRFANPVHRAALARLIERAVLIQIAQRMHWWNLSGRPRIWYEDAHFRVEACIAAHRSYAVTCLPIDGVGIAVAVEIGTGFFATDTLAEVFDPVLAPHEQARRMQRLEKLLGRQRSQKGQLVYNNGRTRSVVYFEQPPNGTTCATTGKIRVGGASYGSLAAYYHDVYPKLVFQENGPAVRVSFKGLDRPQWVAAERVRARVMNEHLPRSLKPLAALAPAERRRLTETFWGRLGKRPFGHLIPGLAAGFWRPESNRVHVLVPPSLRFGGSHSIPAPTATTPATYRDHFNARKTALDRYGCYLVPPAAARELYCTYPQELPEEGVRRFASDIAVCLRRWTGIDIHITPVPYRTLTDAAEQLKRRGRGITLFVLGSEPSAYFDAAFLLEGWRLKRVTHQTLASKWEDLLRSEAELGANRQARQGKSRWDQFVLMTALDVLRQMDVIPWCTEPKGIYEARIVIDVCYDRRYYALSLLVLRDSAKAPAVQLVTHVLTKPDARQEAINARLLEDELVRIFEETLKTEASPTPGSAFTSLASLLILRDGRTVDCERNGITAAMQRLRGEGLLAPDARVDLVDIRKDSLKGIRLWEVEVADEMTIRVTNALEGTAVTLDSQTIVLVTTGEATLRQGTAEPLLLSCEAGEMSLAAAAETVFADAQLNWASPRVAQHLPLPLRRTDVELRARAAQEVRRLK